MPLLFVFCMTACKHKATLFENMDPKTTGVHFANKVVEDDTFNVLTYMNFYTGAGVAAGDINNDGLTDLYFSGNQTSGRLYLNKGNLHFEDVTKQAGLLTNRWCTGVSMVDINQDGWMDIYVNVAGSPKFGDMHNMLFINNRNGTFTERAKEFGIDDPRQTMNASFFDYDRDGDLDLFLITNPADERVAGVNTIHERLLNGESPGSDILYRNNGNNTFTDVSHDAGILVEGYSLGCAISDINGDGWPDIYVSNDFITNDILYINQQDGSFRDESAAFLKHTSFASMGNDVADFNNDGLPDIYTLDMLPEGNYRKKMIIPPASFDKFQMSVQKGFAPQYTRNALQLNNGNGTFSDISFLAGVSSTDWSWSALWADYDNDGDKDLMVTNGFYRDLGNLDYINYQARLQNPMGRQDAKRAVKLQAIKDLKNVPLQNYVFENNNDLTFSNRSNDWGLTEKGFSNGAAYADLDNDGDLDLVVNCFNEDARIYRNRGDELLKNHFLNIILKGPAPNIGAIGAKVFVFSGGQIQMQELNPYRGYESSMQPLIHFGLGTAHMLDSIRIVWPDGAIEMQTGVKADQTLTIAANSKPMPHIVVPPPSIPAAAFAADSSAAMPRYEHSEPDFSDFKVQPLLPHQLSKNGPGIAVGDVNGDCREDFFVGGTSASPGKFFFQTKDHQFIAHPFVKPFAADDMGVLLFDADGDKDLDLYIVGGGSEFPANDSAYQDALFLNDGKGNFSFQRGALPVMLSSGSCVVAADYDRDGDLDLFVGGRTIPGKYPIAPRSYLLRNDGTGGTAHFTDVTNKVCPELANVGMVSAALWSDYDNDGWRDLILSGEFMPLTYCHNSNGRSLQMNTVPQSEGWWNSLAAGDFDNDGDIDYIAGNLGLNTRYKATVAQPLCIYAKDFDKNGLMDPLMCYYVEGKNYLYASRDEMIRQISSMRVRFPTYEQYAGAEFKESFLPEELNDAVVVKSECFESSIFVNEGNGHFKRISLPSVAQFAPVFGITVGDFDGDGNLDALMAGNSYASEASTGRYDAMSGLLMLGNGKNGFTASRSNTTGFKADGDVKAVVRLSTATGHGLVLVASNSAPLESYHINGTGTCVVPTEPDDLYAVVHEHNGRSYREELYWGNNYLSQSSRTLLVAGNAASVTVVDNQGRKREIALSKK